jgi:zinc protease
MGSASQTASELGALGISIGAQKRVLANGLTLITKEIRTAPVVNAQVWYRVGSRHEAPGLNGISHLLEHLMFKGTTTRPLQFGRLFSALGSAFNAFTSYDVTAYFGTVSQNKLAALLTLEADRMVNTVIDPEQLTSEKRVVVSELQGYENSPEYRLGRSVMQGLFPDHAYGLPVGGEKADVESFSLEAVQAHYHRYYRPENALLVITGDFETATLLPQVEAIFGTLQPPPLPAMAPVTATIPNVPPAGTGEILLEEPGSAPLLQMVFPLPAIGHPDLAAIEVLDMIFSAGRSARIYQALVETGMANSAGAYAPSLTERGWYDISAMASPGVSLDQIEAVIWQLITALQTEPVSETELQRAKTQLQANFVLRNRDIDSQASQLAYDEVVCGDYGFSDRHLIALGQVTAAEVQRVAQTYLQPNLAVIGRFQPTHLTGEEAGGVGMQTSEDFSPGEPVDPAEVAQYLPPIPSPAPANPEALPERITLPNGLRLLLLKDTSTATVTLTGHIAAGSAYDVLSHAGLAELTADNLESGTRTKDALALAQVLEDRGVHLDFSAYREGVDISGYALATELPLLLSTLAEMVQESQFPEKEFELTRQQALASLPVDLDDPSRRARRIFQQTLYPSNHPFHSFVTEESLNAIQRQDLVQFYQQHYTPANTILAIVGNFDPQGVQTLITQLFGSWPAPDSPPAPDAQPVSLDWPAVPRPQGIQTQSFSLAGKTQAVTYMGYPGLERNHPLYYAALILNQALGGDTLSSRLGTEIRDRQGLTYGIYSYFAAGRYPGPFVISMQTSPEDTQQAVQSTLALLGQLRQQGLSRAEMEAAQRNLINSYPVELANLDMLARTLISNEVYGLDLDELRGFPERLAAVTMADIDAAIAQLVDPDNMLVVTVGP